MTYIVYGDSFSVGKYHRQMLCEISDFVGESGGVRIIHLNRLADGTVWLMTMYAKNVREDIDVKTLVKIRETLDGKAQRKGTEKVRGHPKFR